MELREQVREWLIDAKVGFIDKAELVARADEAIRQNDTPPDYLIAVSLGEALDHLPRLDLVKEPMDLEDLQRLAARLLRALEANQIDLEGVGAIAARITFPRSDEGMIDAWVQFDWITDELDLVESGIKEGHNLRDRVAQALQDASGHEGQ